jgi:hypothetical protein
MNVFYILLDSGQASGNEFEDRFTVEPAPVIGDKTWMNPDTLTAEWEVVSTRLFRSEQGTEVCLAGLANGPVQSPDVEPSAINLHFFEGKFLTSSFALGFDASNPALTLPELGDFIEYEADCRVKPITKTATHYETLVGDGSCQVYVVHLQPVLVPVAA